MCRMAVISEWCFSGGGLGVGVGEDDAKRSVRRNNQISGVNFHVSSGIMRCQVSGGSGILDNIYICTT